MTPEDITFTKHENGRVTASNFPPCTQASLELMASADPSLLLVHWAGTVVEILGEPYRITSVNHTTGVATMVRVR